VAWHGLLSKRIQLNCGREWSSKYLHSSSTFGELVHFWEDSPKRHFVKCGLDSSMTQDDVDNGRLILLLGLSPKFDGATPFAVILPVLHVRPPSAGGP
jgi:hypothetical protein